ncbi:hypothetical protein KP509_10G077500 [Ceratopteris richardii]|uniref:GH16 domain-containing protein n=1 Tax=Ceratopteris richardii TaxID=49495 RepID=A0A8T2U2K4_CERRI|nr:hypothetical protein KP509_10G077500 [Ceratopteris richardii]
MCIWRCHRNQCRSIRSIPSKVGLELNFISGKRGVAAMRISSKTYRAIFLACFIILGLVVYGSSDQEQAVSLAKDRIDNALSMLNKLIDTDIASKCKDNFISVQATLIDSAQNLDNGSIIKAKRDLNMVEELLGSCLESTLKPQDNTFPTALIDLRETIRGMSSSISSAQDLLEVAWPLFINTTNISNDTLPNHNSNGTTNATWVEARTNPNSSFVPERLAEPAPMQVSDFNISTFIFDYCGDHVSVQSNSVIIRMDQSCGAKLHSTNKFSSGVFSARIRTPVRGTGIVNSFYLSSNDEGSDMISFEFLGNFPNRVLTSYAVNGNGGGNQQMFVLSYDTSVNFHTYTIKWDNESIIWLADNTILRTLHKANASTGYPEKVTSIFCHTWDASSVGDGSYAGDVNWMFGPFRSYFTDIAASSPLVPGSWKAPRLASDAALSLVPLPMRPFEIDYGFSNVGVASNDLSITFNEQGQGARFRSVTTYPSGTFTSRIKCAEGNTSGLLSSFYLSSREGSRVQDEIDFEWLGKDKTSVQTNYYVNGVGNHELQVPLGFDCSEAYHIYTIIYNSDQIQWLVDGKIVRIVPRVQGIANVPYPVKPVYVYASVWNASSVNDGAWTGNWNGADVPFVVYFSDIRIKSP